MVFIPLIGIAADSAKPPAPIVERYRGTARSADGTVLYREEHEVTRDGDRVRRAVSRYVSPDGKPSGVLETEFPSSPYLPQYRFRNFVTGLEEGVRCCTDGLVEPYHRDKSRKMTPGTNWVAGQGFHYLARDRLARLENEGIQNFQFLIPSKLDTYEFRIRSGGRDPSNPNHLQVLLEIDQWFFRLFAPKIVATYDVTTRRLIRYSGPSNLEDRDGRVPKVDITYDYD